MNLLFDFITTRYKTGAGEYVRTVFYNLLDELKKSSPKNIKIFALYDSSIGIAYDELTEKKLLKQNIGIEYIDLHKKNICDIIKTYQINRFFIGCAQYLGIYPDIDKISCETICVIHDLVDEETYQEHLDIYCEILNPANHLKEKKHSLLGCLQYKKNTLTFLQFICTLRKRYWKQKSRTQFICSLNKNNKNFHLITVSNFSRKSISFNLKMDEKSIITLYPPNRRFSKTSSISKEIKETFQNRKIYLFLNANRDLKNPHKTLSAFERFAETNQDSYLLTVNGPPKKFRNHITIPFLNDSDLEYALEHCYALIFPSFFEGFGYPPIEAMRFKKPILASYTTSLPEILGDAPIYFSPLYATDIYKALLELTNNNYEFYSQKSASQYSLISKKSETDFKQLLNYLLEGINE